MRITPNMTADNALFNIQKGRSQMDRLTEQIAADMNILRPSDDPITTRQLLDLENKVKESDTYISNITKSNLWLKMTDTALTGVADIVRAIKGTAATITSGTTDINIRGTVVSQLKEFRKQLVDMANTQLGDLYIFGGFKNSTAAIAGDTTNLSPIVNNVDVTNLSVGMSITGGGFPVGTVISSIGPGNTFTANNQAGGAAAVGSLLSFGSPYNAAPFSGAALTGDLNATTGVSGLDTTNLSVGMPVSGEGIPAGTVITAIGPAAGAITLSNAATITKTGSNLLFGGNFRGTDDRIEVDITRSSRIDINVSGAKLFGGTGVYGSVDMFASLDSLITAIDTNNVAAIQLNAGTFDQSTQQISNARSDVAGRMARLQSAETLLVRDQNTAKGIISNRQNVDYAKAAVELSQQKTAFEAALSTTAKISQLSLLDYI